MKKFILIIRAIAKLVFVLAMLTLVIYVAACIINIWLHNSTDYTYADWNYLVKILKEYFYN
jgi:hypothetical protein